MKELRPGVLGTPGMFSEDLLNAIEKMNKDKTGTGIQGGTTWDQFINKKGKGHVKKPTANDSMKIASLPLSYYQKKWDDHLTGKAPLDKDYIRNLKKILQNPELFHIKGA